MLILVELPWRHDWWLEDNLWSAISSNYITQNLKTAPEWEFDSRSRSSLMTRANLYLQLYHIGKIEKYLKDSDDPDI